MKTGSIIIISVLALAAVGGIAYFLMSKSAPAPVSQTISVSSQDVHGGLVSSLTGILNGFHISFA